MTTRNVTNKKGPITAVILSSCLLLTGVTFAGQASAVSVNEHEVNQTVQFSQAELDQMLAPIALYPDTLLTHILIAATYPIEVIDADRFLSQNKNSSENEINNKAANKDWDPSVKALLPFPRILQSLSEDLTWMRKLGDAFLQGESQVLASIQTLRQKADQAGNLSQMDNVNIVREKQTIIIEPAQPEVVYVPYYDTRVVYGSWHWSHYPPVYWHRPLHYSNYHGPFYWHSGVHIAFDFFFSAFHWNNHHVVRHHHKKRYYHSNRRIATSHHAKRWSHNPHHRKGVAYRSNKMKHRYASHKPSIVHNRVVRKQYNNVEHKANYQKNRHISKQHQQVAKRLKVNKVVKATTPRKQERFQSSPARMKQVNRLEQSRERNKNASVKHNTQDRGTWKKQQRVNKSAPVVYRAPQKSHKQHKARGGHSSKQYARVTKNSSSSTKSHSSKDRQKHR